MIKLALTNKLVNVLAKRLIGKFLAKKLGTDGKINITELYAVEADGRVKIKINAELDVSSKAVETLIESI